MLADRRYVIVWLATMSSGLLKQTLEDAFNELEEVSTGKSKKGKGDGAAITKRHGLKKQRGKRKAEGSSSQPKPKLKVKFKEATAGKAGKGAAADEAVELLLRLDSMTKVGGGPAKAILKHAQKRKRQLTAEEAEPKEQGTVFTDEDFERLSKEYFLHSKSKPAAVQD